MTVKTNNYLFVKTIAFGLMISFMFSNVQAQEKDHPTVKTKNRKPNKVLYGQASFYANKFHGRKTANGEIFSQDKLTAACNVLPLGTWIRVTNLKNGKSITVRTNDRLHPKTRRMIDLTRNGARQLGYISRGLTRVKVVVLD